MTEVTWTNNTQFAQNDATHHNIDASQYIRGNFICTLHKQSHIQIPTSKSAKTNPNFIIKKSKPLLINSVFIKLVKMVLN